MDHARYVGRVGALAVALGVGAGLVWAPGIALAEPSDSGGSTSSSTDGAGAGAGDSDTPGTSSTGDDASGPQPDREPADEDDSDAKKSLSVMTTRSVAGMGRPQATGSSTRTSRVMDHEAADAADSAPARAGGASAMTTPDPQDIPAATAPEAAPAAPTLRTVTTIDAGPGPRPLQVLLAAPVRIFDSIVSALLGPAGPRTPAPTTLWALLAWTRQELHRTFFNRAPRLAAAPVDVEQIDDVVTGTIVGTDPDGDPLTFSVTPVTEKGGTVTVDGAGTFTYVAPAGWNGTDALTDSFTVSAADKGLHIHGLAGLLFGTGHVTSRVVTVQLIGGIAGVTETIPVAVPPGWTNPRTIVGPGGTVAITQRFGSGTPEDPFTTQILVQGPGRPPVTATAAGLVYYGAPLIAGDGTVHMTTVVYAAGTPTITEFTVTTLRPGASPVAWTVTGAPVGGPTLTGAGDFVLTTAIGGGAADDTQTTVTIIRDGQRRDVLTIAGVTQDQAAIGADGTIALAAANAAGGATIGVLRPGAAADYLDLPAALQGPVTVADDGTIVFTTVGVAGFAARAAATTTLWVWRAGEAAVANTAAGTLVQVVTGGGGTVAYVTTTGTGTQDDLITTTVTVLRPGSPDRVSTVVGTLVSSVVAGADGTVALHTYAGPANAFVTDMTVTVMRPNGTVESLTRTTSQIYRIRPAIGPDGTVASMWGNNGMTIAVFRPGQAPIIVTNPNGISIDPRIGSDGTVAFTVSVAGPAGEQYSQIVVLRPGQNTLTASTIGSAWGEPTITGDGTVVISTRVDRNLSYITVLRANGDYLIVPAPGLISNAAQVGPDGVIYLPTDVDGTSVNVTIVNTANRSVTLNLPGRASGFSIKANGGGTDFVTVSLDASGSVSYIINRVFVATVA
ncbi:Ig-like domain-containing protein [Mycolicibacterium frederiksbergense]|uniref:Ig-like domain-containing protein n=1 Tax=Mycolicibacterium frederiksbergense TaxID=117567 RepID=UPI003999E4B9